MMQAQSKMDFRSDMSASTVLTLIIHGDRDMGTPIASLALLLQRAFANHVLTALTIDLLVSAIAFFCFVWVELQRLNASRP